MTEPLFDNRRGGERACGNQVDDDGTAWVIRGSRRPGPGKDRTLRTAGAARAARAAAARRAGARVGGGRGGVRPALPGARGRRVGGRGVVRDCRDTRGRGAGGRGPRPGRRADAAGPRSGPVLAAGGGVAARRLRARPATAARAGFGAGQAAPRGDAAARARGAARGRGLARGAAAAAGQQPAVDRARRRARAAPGVLRGDHGGRPRRGGHDADALALAARRGRRRRRGRSRRPPVRYPPGSARPARGERMSARSPAADPPPPRIMVVTCPDLHHTALSPDPGIQTAQRHERAIAAVTWFCPDVEAVEPGVCAFGARGPARYFGGETALAARITAALADLGEHSRAGVADGLFAALLAARNGRNVPPGGTARFLAAQPVSVLASRVPVGQDPAVQDLAAQDLAALLVRLGLRTLGDFAALPVRDVASRFGDAGEGAHRLARGLDPRPLVARPPSQDLSVAQEFDPPEPRAEPVVFAAKTLAGRLHDGLAARGLTCVRVQVSATWADGRESSRRWRHDGLLSAAAIAERVRWQLDGTQPASPGDENAP